MYPLKALPHDELTRFMSNQFKKGGKKCPKVIAEKISEKIVQYPYYAQALAYHVYEISAKEVEEQDIK